MAYDIKGAVHIIAPTQQVNDRFSKRSLVLSVMDGKYEQLIEFEATGDKCGELDSFVEGEEVRVTFNVRGREWKKPGGDTRYFVSLNIWKVERVGERKQEPAPYDAPAAGGGSDAPGRLIGDPEDDIPFITSAFIL
ncbi:MAG: DUF3127 domain-containing protein [Hyphomicrobiaceae bacterium]